jgi:hypothetical protein
MTNVISSDGTSDDPPPDPIYSSKQEREEIENWRDSIAERLWEQYSTTLQLRRQGQLASRYSIQQ